MGREITVFIKIFEKRNGHTHIFASTWNKHTLSATTMFSNFIFILPGEFLIMLQDAVIVFCLHEVKHQNDDVHGLGESIKMFITKTNLNIK